MTKTIMWRDVRPGMKIGTRTVDSIEPGGSWIHGSAGVAVKWEGDTESTTYAHGDTEVAVTVQHFTVGTETVEEFGRAAVASLMGMHVVSFDERQFLVAAMSPTDAARDVFHAENETEMDDTEVAATIAEIAATVREANATGVDPAHFPDTTVIAEWETD